MSYKIIYEKYAKISMREIGWYYKENVSDAVSKSILSKITTSVAVLSEFPFRFPATNFSKNVRKLSVKKAPYVVYYFIKEDTVFILEVLHQRQDHSFLSERYQDK